MTFSAPTYLTRPHAPALAYEHVPAQYKTAATDQCTCRGIGVLFLCGFMSDMSGDKATALADYCAQNSIGFTRFDYRGHGISQGDFTDGCIGLWLQDTLAIMDAVTGKGQLVIIGSSMGGWLMLLAALQRPERIHALIGIAAAPDFTETLVRQTLTDAQRHTLMHEGLVHIPSEYGESYPITRTLIEDGRNHLLLQRTPDESNRGLPIHCPVRLLQGTDDTAVPTETATRIADCLASDDVETIIVKGGTHTLSTERDLTRLKAVLGQLL